MWEGARLVRQNRRLKALLIAGALAALLAAGTWFMARHVISTSPFPSSMNSKTQLSLFYPKTLPDGYVIDPHSIAETDGVITYVAEKSAKYINFSIQPRAEKFDFATFYGTVLTQSFKFTTPFGEATVGNMQSNGNTVGSLINADTWVIVSAPAEVKPSQVQSIINDLAVDNR